MSYVIQTGSLRNPMIVWSGAALCSIALTLMIIGAPLAMNSGHVFWGLAVYKAFSYVCHQIPERSFFIAGHQFAVCSRCSGIYFGFTAATLCYPLVRSLRQTETPARMWLFLAAAPLAVDFSLGCLGIWQNTHWSRFATGALLGVVSVFYVLPGLMDLAQRSKRNSPAPATTTTFATALHAGGAAAPSDYSAPHRRI